MEENVRFRVGKARRDAGTVRMSWKSGSGGYEDIVRGDSSTPHTI